MTMPYENIVQNLKHLQALSDTICSNYFFQMYFLINVFLLNEQESRLAC